MSDRDFVSLAQKIAAQYLIRRAATQGRTASDRLVRIANAGPEQSPSGRYLVQPAPSSSSGSA